MLGKDVFNGIPMMILCVLAMIIVVIQPVLFLWLSWKHGKEMGLSLIHI